MSPRSALSILFVIAALALAATACAGGGQPIDTGDPGGGGVVFDGTFTNGAFAAMARENCGEDSGLCHNTVSPGGTDLFLPDADGALSVAAAYAAITSSTQSPLILNLASDADSILLKKGEGLPTHVGASRWSPGDATYVAVLAWITSGAQMN